MVNYCCVPLCKNNGKNSKMHRFPLDEKLCELWIARIKSEKFEGKTLGDILKAFRVCDIHFDESARIGNGRGRRGSNLKYGSLPSLHLPHFKEMPVISFAEAPLTECEPIPGTSRFDCSANTEKGPAIQDDSSSGHTLEACIEDVSITRTPKTRKDLRKRINILKYLGSSRIDLTPRAKKLYRIATNLRKTARRLDFELSSAKKRIKNAQKGFKKTSLY